MEPRDSTKELDISSPVRAHPVSVLSGGELPWLSPKSIETILSPPLSLPMCGAVAHVNVKSPLAVIWSCAASLHGCHVQNIH
jgi:hypothetical protein